MRSDPRVIAPKKDAASATKTQKRLALYDEPQPQLEEPEFLPHDSQIISLSSPMATSLPLNDNNELPRYVAVEGPIGAGKTSLATRLAQTFKYPLLLEPASDNPFLDRFYREGRQHALPTQLFFLLHRADQVAKLAGPDLVGPTVISDFLIEKDRLFAQLTLDQNELALYEQIHENLMLDAPAPDLVIYLQAPISVLLDRIRERGIASEQYIDSDYLSSLSEAYTDFFHFYDQAPLLIVNAEEADFSHNDRHFDALLEQVTQMNGVRQYFNPHPTLI